MTKTNCRTEWPKSLHHLHKSHSVIVNGWYLFCRK